MITKIYIENQLLDLFKDETMDLTSSIADTDDITKINSDYTKSFTVPASDNNNKIFKHYYNADIDNTFDARTKKNAYIELGGLPFRTGKMRLDKVIVKKGKPSSYSINFWGNLVNFKTLIKEDELTSLDLSAYTHEYNSDNVKLGLTNGLFGGDIVYNLLSKKRQFIYDETPSNNTNTDALVNISYNGNNRGIVWSELNPSIRLLSIIEAIEYKYGFMFSRDFFGRNEFTNLYMWLNNSAKVDELPKQVHEVDFDGGDSTWVNLTTNTGTFYVEFNSTFDYTRFRHYLTITPDIASSSFPYTLKCFLNGVLFSEATYTGTQTDTKVSTIFNIYNGTYTLRYEIEAPVNFTYSSSWENTQSIRTSFGVPPVITARITTSSGFSFTSDLLINTILPKIKIIDFLKGLVSMFKLVLIPDNDGLVYVNNTNDYYREGNLINISDYVDFETYDVSRGVIKNNLDFKFKEPKTILNKQFKLNTGISYGDESANLTDENGEPLDGDSLEINLPFETVLFERLTNLQTGELSNVQYGLILDEKLEPTNPEPFIFYNDLVQLGTNKLSFINDSGVSELINTNISTPSHTIRVDVSDFSVLWGVEFSTWNYNAIYGTLFKNYWEPYVESIFNIKKRNFKFKAFLPVHILTKMQLNDVLFIKNRYYRINDFTVNLNTGESELNLINTFETNFGLFLPSSENVFLNYKAQSTSVYVSNGSVMNIVLQDIGFGTSWATVIQSGSNIVITVTENTLIENRLLIINVDNGSGKSFSIILNQDNKIVTFDTNIQTFDNTILTFDAE